MIFMPRSSTCGTIGAVLLSCPASGHEASALQRNVVSRLRTSPMYMHGCREARWDRAETEEFCAAWNAPCSRALMSGENGEVLNWRFCPLFFFNITSYRSMEGMVACHHLFPCASFLIFFLIFCIRGRHLSPAPGLNVNTTLHWPCFSHA